jgi:hypothetical protein
MLEGCTAGGENGIVMEVLKCLKVFHNVPSELQDRFTPWSTADPSTVHVEGSSGFGGGKTLKMGLAHGGDKTNICVHLYGETFAVKTPVGDRFKARLKKAHDTFSSAGLAPPRLATWEKGFIEPWCEGGCMGKPMMQDWHEKLSEKNCEALGRLLSQIHSVDTSWFDDIREQTLQKYPQLVEAEIGPGSYLWRDSGLIEEPLQTWLDANTLEYFKAAGPAPVTEAGKAIVTTHGDFHCANVLLGGLDSDGRFETETEELDLNATGVLICDFENSGTGPAIADLCYAIALFLSFPSPNPTLGTDAKDRVHSTAEQYAQFRLALCRGYLQGSNRAAGEEEVFALALDAERCSLRFMCPYMASIPGTEGKGTAPALQCPSLHAWWYTVPEERLEDVGLYHARSNGGDFGAKYSACLAVVDAALSDRALAEEVVAKGLRHSEAFKAVCEKHRPPPPSTDPTGKSAGKNAEQIAEMLVGGLTAMAGWPEPFQMWAKGMLEHGDAGIQKALELMVGDQQNMMGIKFVPAEFREEIKAACLALKFEDAFKNNVLALGE